MMKSPLARRGNEHAAELRDGEHAEGAVNVGNRNGALHRSRWADEQDYRHSARRFDHRRSTCRGGTQPKRRVPARPSDWMQVFRQRLQPVRSPCEDTR